MADKRRERSLPDEETEMILMRLPLKDLACYKLVCKDWRSLISSPDFVSAHLNRSKSDPSSHYILVHDDIPGPVGSTLPGPFKSVIYCLSPAMVIVGSINGLICMVGNYRNHLLSPDDIFILNPVTRHSKKLPLPTSPINILTDTVTFAFWWDSITDDYKVVKIVCKSDATLAKVWVSSSDTWSEITVNCHRHFYRPPYWVTGCDIVVEGFAYWIVVDSHGPDLFVASLDMRTQVLKQISLPQLSMSTEFLVRCVSGHIYNFFFFGANWKGNFALVEKASDMYNVWMMDGSGGWSKNFSFHVDFGFQKCINSINGKLVLERGDDGITLYDMETQKVELLGDSELGGIVPSAHDFVGSLVSMEGFKPLEDDIGGSFGVVWPGGDSKLAGIVASAHDSVSIDGFKPLEDDISGSFYDIWGDPVSGDSKLAGIVASAHDSVSIDGFKPLEDDISGSFNDIWPDPASGW